MCHCVLVMCICYLILTSAVTSPSPDFLSHVTCRMAKVLKGLRCRLMSGVTFIRCGLQFKLFFRGYLIYRVLCVLAGEMLKLVFCGKFSFDLVTCAK